MRAGVLLTFQNLHKDLTDEDVYKLEMGIAESAEDFGFDSIWAVEHHFEDYAMCPDNFTVLSYLAARTSRIKLRTGAVILPWNDPLRVAEKAVLLDYLSEGRFELGLGRGLARIEYEGFGIPMEEARGRFDEGAAMVLEALETGKMNGTGQYYGSRPEVSLRPAPSGRSFKDRVYSVGISPESVNIAADLGAALMAFIQKPMDVHAEAVAVYRERFRAVHNREPKAPVLAQQMICHADPEKAEELAYRYIGQYFHSVVHHYDFGGTHFAKTKGYESYSQGAAELRDAGEDAAARGYVPYQLWGTPDQILDKLRGYKEVVGDFESLIVPCVGDMAPDDKRASYELFAKEVVPALHNL